MSAVPIREKRQTQRVAWLIAGAGAVLLATNDDGHHGMHGSGVPAAQTRVVPAFSRIELAGSNAVTVHVGGSRSVVVHGDRNLLSRVTTTVRAGRLVIDTIGSRRVPRLDR
jgi:hypothetical protein